MKTTNYIIKREEKTKIVIQDFAIDNLDKILEDKNCSSFVLFSDTTAFNLFGKQIVNVLKSTNLPVIQFVIEPGEKNKTLEVLEKFLDFLLKNNCNRKTTLIGLGGGVICDMATFAAGIFYREINCVLIPTTLLSQVDASIGGKGGVNVGKYKNILGVIKQPDTIIIDPKTLKNLPKEQITSGMAEIIKMAISFDKPFFDYLSTVSIIDDLFIKKAIEESVGLKMKIVENDPLEQTDTRTTLNFGHSLGHAIELLTEIPHGNAVSIGIVFAMEVSKKIMSFPQTDAEKVVGVLKKFNLPVYIKGLKKDNVLEHMKKDKKNFGGDYRLVLLSQIGKSKVIKNIDKEIINYALEKVLI